MHVDAIFANIFDVGLFLLFEVELWIKRKS
jgi:hypothetical protein